MSANISIGRAARNYVYQIADPSSTTVALPAWLSATVGTGWSHTQLAEATTQSSCNMFTASGSVVSGGACSLQTGLTRCQRSLEHIISVLDWEHRGGSGWAGRFDISMFIADVAANTFGVWWEYRAADSKCYIRWTTATATYSEVEVSGVNLYAHDNAKCVGLGWVPNRNVVRIYDQGEMRAEIPLANGNGNGANNAMIRAGLSQTCRVAAGNGEWARYRDVTWARY